MLNLDNEINVSLSKYRLYITFFYCLKGDFFRFFLDLLLSKVLKRIYNKNKYLIIVQRILNLKFAVKINSEIIIMRFIYSSSITKQYFFLT